MADQISNPLNATNYCLGFLDLLGQREAMGGQGLLPTMETDDDENAFQAIVIDTIGPIRRVQKDIDNLLDYVCNPDTDSPVRAKLPEEQRPIWDEMQRSGIKRQSWSDGLVVFESLGNQNIKCPMNGVYAIFVASGMICFLGLAGKQPVRGAIDIGWGVELHPGEVYGPVMTRAYELESEIAQYPRIVVGSDVLQFLERQLNHKTEDAFSQMNYRIAELCSKMLIRDVDGYMILHYLGSAFQDAAGQRLHQEMYDRAFQFVTQQLAQHQKSGNSKLALRYAHLANYYRAHTPTKANQERQT